MTTDPTALAQRGIGSGVVVIRRTWIPAVP